MNYEELQKADELLREIRNIETHFTIIENTMNSIRVSVIDNGIYFNNKYKQKFITIMKEIRDEKLKELNELGVTEND